MDFEYSERTQNILDRLRAFVRERVVPAEAEFLPRSPGANPSSDPSVLERLKDQARAEGLWNLFMPGEEYGAGLTNLEYAPLAEEMGRSAWAAEVFNCSAPDTGNMEVLAHYGSAAQRERWLTPLLNGSIRSAYAMTERDVASSDATNISLDIQRRGDTYLLNGTKWWITGLAHPKCELLIVMGRTGGSSRHQQHSMLIVPRETSGVKIIRHLTSFGYDDAPHGHVEVHFDNVEVGIDQLILGEGRGFEIAQGRLGPGRIHHCMRSIGAAERALELLCRRVTRRVAFGRTLGEYGVWRERIAEARCRIDMARLLTLKAAALMDAAGNKAARKEIAMIKVVAPNVACQIIDWAIQAYGAAGVSEDFGLAAMYASQRALRIADGPDEVHRETVAKLELRSYAAEP